MNGTFLRVPKFLKPKKGFLQLHIPSGSLALVYMHMTGNLGTCRLRSSFLVVKLLNLNLTLLLDLSSS